MAPSTLTIPPKRLLPSKESALFKDLLNHYETRQLKKGQKTADQILKKFPEHGETLCMKGLVLTHMGKRDEGLELVKKGIRLDLTSHICWHVFGLIQKGEKNYEEALKSYTQALRFDKENLNLLQDAANLQTQLRLYDNLQETRHTILKLRPNLRRNWVALAVAYHLSGNLVHTKKVLEQYEATLKNIPDYDVEHSEILLYHTRVLQDLGEYADALALLDDGAKSRAIVDRISIMEYRASLLSKLEMPSDAEQAWRDLIEHNSENYEYYRGFFLVKGIQLDSVAEERREEVLDTFTDLSRQFRRATAPKRLALIVASGDQFKDLARSYILNGLSRGVPSLFADLKSLYTDSSKQQVIEELILEFSDTFAPSATGPAPVAASEPPTTYLWTLYYLAQHQSHLRRFKAALAILGTAIEHTPTLPELHTCRARVLKRAGDFIGAARCLEDARLLDGQDRFLNTKSGKYNLRAGLIDEASDILGLFTKKDATSPAADLEDMQSMLFIIEDAGAHARLGRPGIALRRYLSIQKIFEDIFHDQFDFHSYSIRRFTVNIYLNLMAWEDRIRSNPAFIKSTVEASAIYVRLHDDPSIATASAAAANLTGAAKKAQKKAKKAAIKNQEDPKKAGTANAANEDKGLEPGPIKDEDPDGTKALSVADPLEQAWRLLKPFALQTTNPLEIWIAIYDVSVRRSKYLQAAKALLQAQSISATYSELHIRTVDFRQRVSSLSNSPPEPIGSALSSSISKLVPDDLALDTYNSQYLQQHSTSAKSILASAKVSHKLTAPLNEVEDVVFRILSSDVNADIQTCLAACSFLNQIQAPRHAEFRAACDAHFELSTVFKTPDDLVRLRARSANGDLPPEDPENLEVIS